MDQILYHYCGLDAFLSIIKNSTLWLSDIRKSNDYLECVYCRDKINEKIRGFLEDDKEALEAWDFGYNINSDLSMDMISYVACFSENKDQLSQWRGYADNGAGIAVGFSRESFADLKEAAPSHISFRKVIYDEKEQEKFIERIARESIKAMETKPVAQVAAELNQNYRLQFPVLKNASFEEEAEWRIIFNDSFSKRKRHVGKNILFSGIRYTVREKRLVSYIEMDFSKLKYNAIKEIWIGPKAEVEIQDILHLLDVYGYYDDVENYNESAPIKIAHSASSYRSALTSKNNY